MQQLRGKRSAVSRAHQNPLGIPVKAADQHLVVLVGKLGKFTHLYDSNTGTHACKSGINAGRGGPSGAQPELYATDSKRITCYRCAKLAEINWEKSDGRSIAPPTGRR